MQPGMAWYSFMCSFIHSLAHSFILVHSFIHWFIHAIICSIIGSIVHSFICSFIHLFFHSFFPTTGLKHHIVYQELKTNPQHLSIINFLHFHNKALHVLMIAMLIIRMCSSLVLALDALFAIVHPPTIQGLGAARSVYRRRNCPQCKVAQQAMRTQVSGS